MSAWGHGGAVPVGNGKRPDGGSGSSSTSAFEGRYPAIGKAHHEFESADVVVVVVGVVVVVVVGGGGGGGGVCSAICGIQVFPPVGGLSSAGRLESSRP